MTNEELATRIQAGERSLMPTLWEQSRRLVYYFAVRWYQRNRERCIVAGVALDDLKQEGYFAVLNAVKAFKPEKSFSFNSYLSHHLQNCFAVLAGYRRSKSDAFYAADRLDRPIAGEEEALSLADTVKDPEGEDSLHRVEMSIWREQVKEVLDRARRPLTDKQNSILDARYYAAMDTPTAAKVLQLPSSIVTQEGRKALRKMRTGKERKNLLALAYHNDIIDRYGRCGGFSFWKAVGSSSVEYTIVKLESKGLLQLV